MYDFNFGSKDSIESDPISFLLGIKRMLPRWLNSIPDSEYLAIYNLLTQQNASRPVFVETGVGASTLVLLYMAMKSDGVLFSWDIANPKGAAIRNICNDTLSRHFGRTVWDHWKFIPYTSTSPYLGIPILNEFKLKVNGCFCDSDHTWKTLGEEISLLLPLLQDESIVIIDDANYTYLTENISYINMMREKIGLKITPNIKSNECAGFATETEALLTKKFSHVEKLTTSYSDQCYKDIYFDYYTVTRSQMHRMEMEKSTDLANRFAAWKIRTK